MFYERFKALCDKKGVTPSRAAIEAGISKSLVSKWKANESKEPSPEVIRKLADYFGISAFEVLEDLPQKEKTSQPDELEGVYLSFARQAQESHIDPKDIMLAIETIKKLRGD
ncbi:MAG: helix-turn-helix transcriptional regulator [Butyricicoccus pullicaecorum]|nr:helix-turn-helix transcriptional regulator [Butyricicoccus pullicaecorum]